jgi:zinc transport system ATP-binding protein
VLQNSQDVVLQFNKVCFAYNEEEVLHDINFEIKRRSFVGIVGPNGGGKTTLLRLALGLEAPQRGSISLFSKEPALSRPHIGYVMQHLQYDKHFPIRTLDVVLMGLAQKRMIGPFRKADKRAAFNTLEQVGIKDLYDKTFSSLSGGQQQRALIAQALVSNPSMLILDEPTANVDTAGETAIHELLRILAGEITILMVSHNINTVLDCATHVLCINRSSVYNQLSKLHPDVIERAKGGGIAVLHHELNCKVFDSSEANQYTVSESHPGTESNK